MEKRFSPIIGVKYEQISFPGIFAMNSWESCSNFQKWTILKICFTRLIEINRLILTKRYIGINTILLAFGSPLKCKRNIFSFYFPIQNFSNFSTLEDTRRIYLEGKSSRIWIRDSGSRCFDTVSSSKMIILPPYCMTY